MKRSTYIKEKLMRRGWTEDNIRALRTIRDCWNDINWFKTIWINFKVLPLKQASNLPIIVGRNVRVKNAGKIILMAKPTPGVISIAVLKIPNLETNENRTVVSNDGTIVFYGRAKFHPGAKVIVYPNAVLSLGNRVGIGSLSKVVCSEKITIGNDVRISWNSQLFDTDFHFLSNLNKDKTYPRRKPIIIEDEVFIGNSCTIGKKTHITAGSVVSCCSKVTGDYSQEGPNLLFVGNPATIVAKGFKMSSGWFPEIEEKTGKLLGES